MERQRPCGPRTIYGLIALRKIEGNATQGQFQLGDEPVTLQSLAQKTSTAEVRRVAAASLVSFAQRILSAAGIPAADAETVAQLMVEADLRGSDTHGVIRLR